MNPFEQFQSDWTALQADRLAEQTRLRAVEASVLEARDDLLARVHAETSQIASVVSNTAAEVDRLVSRLGDLEGRVRRAESAADPDGWNNRIHRAVKEAEEHTNRQVTKFASACADGQEHTAAIYEARIESQRREMAHLKGEIATLRQAIEEIKDAYMELLRDWARYKRVTEGLRASNS